MSIAGTYQNTSNDNVAGVFKALGATDQMIAAGSDKEEKTLIITDNGGDSFTIDIGPAKSTFKVGETFDNTIMGGKLTVKIVVKKPNASTLERHYSLPSGKSFTSTLVFTGDGATNTIKCGDVTAKRVYKRS